MSDKKEAPKPVVTETEAVANDMAVRLEAMWQTAVDPKQLTQGLRILADRWEKRSR